MCICACVQGVCTPVSWYADTSAEDVKTAVLCACDVLADDIDGVEASAATGGFCLRLIQPLPDVWVSILLLMLLLLLHGGSRCSVVPSS